MFTLLVVLALAFAFMLGATVASYIDDAARSGGGGGPLPFGSHFRIALQTLPADIWNLVMIALGR